MTPTLDATQNATTSSGGIFIGYRSLLRRDQDLGVTAVPREDSAMQDPDMRVLIEQGDVQGVARALQARPALANATIEWVLNQSNASDPLHYVSDCVGHGWLTDTRAGEIAGVLLAHGAAINGSRDRESPLIASASVGAEAVARVLVKAGAALEGTSVFGARALHWAAWMGSASTVGCLIEHGAEIEPRCAEFEATPLFWAIHGYGPKGPMPKQDQVGAAKLLIQAGASMVTGNKLGLSALELSRHCDRDDMYRLLQECASQA